MLLKPYTMVSQSEFHSPGKEVGQTEMTANIWKRLPCCSPSCGGAGKSSLPPRPSPRGPALPLAQEWPGCCETGALRLDMWPAHGNVSNVFKRELPGPGLSPLFLLGSSSRCCKVSEPFRAKARLSLPASCLGSLQDSVLSEALPSESRGGSPGSQLHCGRET